MLLPGIVGEYLITLKKTAFGVHSRLHKWWTRIACSLLWTGLSCSVSSWPLMAVLKCSCSHARRKPWANLHKWTEYRHLSSSARSATFGIVFQWQAWPDCFQESPPIDCKTPTILKGQTVHRRLAYCDHKYCKRYSPTTTRKRKKKSFQVGGIIYNYIFLTLIFLKPVLSAIFSLSRPSCLDDLQVLCRSTA